MKKAVFIDWDDTLGDWGTAARLAQEDVYQQFKIAEWGVPFEDWYEAYHTHNAELWHLYGHGQIDRPFLMMDRFLHPIPSSRRWLRKVFQCKSGLAYSHAAL